MARDGDASSGVPVNTGRFAPDGGASGPAAALPASSRLISAQACWPSPSRTASRGGRRSGSGRCGGRGEGQRRGERVVASEADPARQRASSPRNLAGVHPDPCRSETARTHTCRPDASFELSTASEPLSEALSETLSETCRPCRAAGSSGASYRSSAVDAVLTSPRLELTSSAVGAGPAGGGTLASAAGGVAVLCGLVAIDRRRRPVHGAAKRVVGAGVAASGSGRGALSSPHTARLRSTGVGDAQPQGVQDEDDQALEPDPLRQ
jgi:hypothetical protein